MAFIFGLYNPNYNPVFGLYNPKLARARTKPPRRRGSSQAGQSPPGEASGPASPAGARPSGGTAISYARKEMGGLRLGQDSQSAGICRHICL
ncbi:hypothetical protein AVI55_17705 (plasmid) [Piscirickettsia salmonis]|nr:hypothetical protein AVI55_17705 [Piscirickettsia salmonis]